MGYFGQNTGMKLYLKIFLTTLLKEPFGWFVNRNKRKWWFVKTKKQNYGALGILRMFRCVLYLELSYTEMVTLERARTISLFRLIKIQNIAVDFTMHILAHRAGSRVTSWLV